VAAAGNDGTTPIIFPASGDNVIAVGATYNPDGRWTATNYGSGLDVMAPGVGVRTTTNAGTYAGFSGTSFSSPQVAALAGLIFSANPALTNTQVVNIITKTADKIGSNIDPSTGGCNGYDSTGWSQYCGYGRINACNALKAAVPTSTVVCPTPTSSPTPVPSSSSPTPTPIPTPTSDTTAPSVNITSPTSGSTVSGTSVSFNVDATDNIGVTKVEFYVDGALLPNGTEVSSPYTASWDSTTYSNSTHTLSAKAYDLAGNVGNSSSVIVNVNNITPTPIPTPVPTPAPADTTKPSVSIISPLNGSILKTNSKINITANATDNIKISKVETYVAGVLKCSSTLSSGPYLCPWSVPGKKNTSYTITIKAYDTSSNTNSASITVKAQ
jgi:hypothetical protein